MKKITLAMFVIVTLFWMLSGCDNTTATNPPPKPEAAKPAADNTPAEKLGPEAPKAPVSDKIIQKDGKKLTTDSGLQIEDKKIGDGAEVKSGDTVVVNYRGWLDDGKEFDSSLKPGRDPFSFKVGAGMVIKGWDEGLVGMKIGGKRELTIPSKLGYGSRGQGPIPADSTLHFEIDLISIK